MRGVRLPWVYPAIVYSLWSVWLLRSYVPYSLRPVLNSWRDLLPPHMAFVTALALCIQQPWARDLGMAAVLTLAAIGAGGWILDRLRISASRITALERVTFSAAVGFAALVMIASALGVPGLFRPLPLRILLAVFTVAGLWRLPAEAPHLRAFAQEVARGLRREPLACLPLAVTAIFCWFALLYTAAPETAFDAVMVYLPYPQEFLRRGTFSLVELYRGNIPLYGVVFFTLGQVLHSDLLRSETSARMFNFLTFPGVLFATAALARTACRNLARPVFYVALAVCWVATCRILGYHATICYPDLGVVLWSTLAIQAAMRLLEARHSHPAQAPWILKRNWAVLTGWFAGMAAGIKFSGMYWIILCGLAIVAGYTFFPEDSSADSSADGAAAKGTGEGPRFAVWSASLPARLREGLAVATIFAAVGAAVFLPWLIRNWINTGDPLHPAFQHLLRHPAIDLKDARADLAGGLNRSRLPFTIGNLLAIPWWMTFGADRFVGTVGPVLLWTLPFLVLGWRRDRYWLLLAGLFPLFGVFWLLGPQWCRYFLPAVPLDAVLGASALANMRLPRFLTVLLGGMALFMVLPNLPGMDRALAVNTYMPAEVPYGPALGLQSGEEYRRRNLGLYAAAEYANSLGLPASTAVLAVPAMDTLPAWHTRYRVVDIWDNLHVVCTSQNGHEAPCYSITGDPLLRGLDRAGIGLLAIRHNDRFVMQTGALRLEDPMLREHFRMRGSGGGVFFFERNRLARGPVGSTCKPICSTVGCSVGTPFRPSPPANPRASPRFGPISKIPVSR